MATYNNNIYSITNGPNRWDLILTLFDSDDRQRLLSFTDESERHRELESARDHVFGGYKGLTHKEQAEVEIEEANHKCLTCGEMISEESPHAHPPEDEGMPAWSCDWCEKSFPGSEQPHQTYDGEEICHNCWERDDEGPQIARIGRNQYEDDHEGVRIVDADGKVDYE